MSSQQLQWLDVFEARVPLLDVRPHAPLVLAAQRAQRARELRRLAARVALVLHQVVLVGEGAATAAADEPFLGRTSEGLKHIYSGHVPPPLPSLHLVRPPVLLHADGVRVAAQDVALEVAPALGAVRAVGALELRLLAALLAQMQHEALLPAVLLAALLAAMPLR